MHLCVLMAKGDKKEHKEKGERKKRKKEKGREEKACHSSPVLSKLIDHEHFTIF